MVRHGNMRGRLANYTERVGESVKELRLSSNVTLCKKVSCCTIGSSCAMKPLETHKAHKSMRHINL